MTITRLEQVTSPVDGRSLVLLFLEQDTLKRLLVLNADNLSLVRIEKNDAFTTFLGGDVQGRFLSGATAFTAGTSATTDFVLKAALDQYDQPERLSSIGAGAFNALLGLSGASIRLMDFTTAQSWGASNTYTATISSGTSYNFLDIVRGDGSTDAIRLLFNREGRLVVAKFNDFNALRTAINAASSSDFISESSVAAGPTYDGSRAWITRDGMVVGDGNERRLSFYPFSNLAQETSIDIGRKYEDTFISVDGNGERWFLYDSESRWLYALRTWW